MTATRAGFVRDSFAGNQIPAGRLSADALRLMMLYPEPNVAGLNNNYVVNRQNTDDTHSFDTRVDHNFSNDGSLLRPLQLLEQPQAAAVALRR